MNLMEKHVKTFGTDKPIIGCVHLTAMPGTPYYDKNYTIEEQIKRAKREARILQDLGYDAIVFANEADRPYLMEVGPEVVATYVRITSAVVEDLEIPYGCGVLIDPIATIAIANAIGANFIRTYVSNSYETTFGTQRFVPGEIFRYKKQIQADQVNIYTYFEAHAGVELDTRDILDQIASGFEVMPISGMLIGGPRAGLPPEASKMAEVKKMFPDYPLIMGSGSNKDNIQEMLQYCDGVIVGTTIKKDKYLYNEIDYDRAKEFIEFAKGRN